jgi:hypothetical protein
MIRHECSCCRHVVDLRHQQHLTRSLFKHLENISNTPAISNSNKNRKEKWTKQHFLIFRPVSLAGSRVYGTAADWKGSAAVATFR